MVMLVVEFSVWRDKILPPKATKKRKSDESARYGGTGTHTERIYHLKKKEIQCQSTVR